MKLTVVALAVLVALMVAGQVQAVPHYLDGTDYMATNIGALDIQILSGSPLFDPMAGYYTTSTLSGHTIVSHQNPNPADYDGDNDGLVDIPTEMLEFEHSGTIMGMPLQTHQSIPFGTYGVVETRDPAPNEDAGSGDPYPADYFPANSFFDVFFDLDITVAPGTTLTLFNLEALRMTAVIDDLPPSPGIVYGVTQDPLDWWPEDPADVDPGYVPAPNLDDMPLKLYYDTGTEDLHVANLTGHPEHEVVPEASSIIGWCLIGLTFLGMGGWWRRRRKA